MYILLAILVFGVLIFVHELGHYAAAKLLGVKVNEFAICMGPTIFKKTVGETTYSLRCLPVGGFCAMEGEDGDSEDPRSFTSAAWWKRLIILVAGSFMNLVAGFLIVLVVLGTAQGFSTTELAAVYPGSAMEEGGMQAGDTLYSIDGERVYQYSDIDMLMSRNTTGASEIVVVRGGEKVKLTKVPLEKREIEVDGQKKELYGMELSYEEATPGALLRNAVYSCMDFSRLVRMGLSDLVTGKVGLSEMGGPVSIVNTMNETGKAAETTSDGVLNVLYLAAFIAVNLAVMNMLPIPALDGGRVFLLLVTTLLQAITRRKINPKYEGYIHAAGMVLLLLFMAFITFKDVWTLIFK